MNIKIIGHRGSAGTALENTLESFRAGIEAGADALELDVRMTRDKQVVVCHDADLLRIANDKRLVARLNLKDLQKIKLLNNEHLPTLVEVLELIKNTPVVVEIKEYGMARAVLAVFDKFPDNNATIASFKLKEVVLFKSLSPDTKCYAANRDSPFEILDLVSSAGLDGVDLNFWILNPWTYFLARRRKLDIMVYTVNHKFLARFIHFLYPKVMICTDYPNKLREL